MSSLWTAYGRSWGSRAAVCRYSGPSGWCACWSWFVSCRLYRDSWWCWWRPWITWPPFACFSCSSSSSSGTAPCTYRLTNQFGGLVLFTCGGITSKKAEKLKRIRSLSMKHNLTLQIKSIKVSTVSNLKDGWRWSCEKVKTHIAAGLSHLHLICRNSVI